jgi:hypothetical protein
MNYSNRIFLYGPVALFAALVLAMMGYWWVASNALSKKLDQWNGHEIAPGVHLSFANKAMSGFPFRVDSQLDDLHVEIETSHGPTVWGAEHFALHSLAYGAGQYVFEAAGKQIVQWHDDRGQLHEYDFLPGTLRASSISDRDGLARFDIQILDVSSADISAARVEFHVRRNPTIDGYDLAATADGVHFSADLDAPFGTDLKHFGSISLISPGSSFAKFLDGHGDWRPAVEDWRKSDGGLKISSLEISWGDLNAKGSGALTADALHRPFGALHLSIEGWSSLSQSNASTTRTREGPGIAKALAMVELNQHASAGKPLDITATFKDGMFYVGSIPADLLSPLY